MESRDKKYEGCLGFYKSRVHSYTYNQATVGNKKKQGDKKRQMEQIGIKTLQFFLLPVLVLSHDTEVCPSVHTCLTTLTQAFDTLCNETMPPPPCTCPVEWESFNMIQLGVINMLSSSTQSFVIPTAVPSTAKEVLVYVNTYMGYSTSRRAHLKVYTESSPTRRFEKYLAIHTYSQEAYATASDNMFFPMPNNRRVYVRLSRALTGNVFGYINVIGYR